MPFSINISNIIQNAVSQIVRPTGTTVNTILQCFVDQNLETNENVFYTFQRRNVSFDYSSININEGATASIRIGLDAPSTLGIEEVDLYFLNQNIGGVDTNNDLSLSFGFLEPLRLAWSAGEQYKFISITANNDFLIENTENFNLKLDHFVNLSPGNFTNLNVGIINTTVFRKVGIESTNGSMIIPTNGPIGLNYSLVEGESKDIIISLDSPSIFGIEEVDVVFFSTSSITGVSANDYALNLPQPIRLTWSVGEQTKIISLSAIADTDYFEPKYEELGIQLSNPAFVDIVTAPISLPSSGIAKFPGATATIENVTVDFEYTRVYLGPFATQPGRIATWPSYNLLQPVEADPYGPPFVFFPNSYTYSNHNRFFWYNPGKPNTDLFNFNSSKLRVDIKNAGNYPILYNNTVLNVGQSISVNPNTLYFYLDLPANFSQNLTSSGTTIIVGGAYEISVYMSYTGNGPNSTYYYGEFKLKDFATNTTSSNKTFNLGYQFFNTYSQSTFSSSTNSYYLITKMSNVGTGRSAGMFGMNCPGGLAGFNINQQENAAVDGLYFIDSYSTTDYIGLEFRQGGGIVPTCNSTFGQNQSYEIIP